MAIIPEKKNTTVTEIYKSYEDDRQTYRNHLGASLIGEECLRKLWYGFRWAKKPNFDGRLLRLFHRGDLEEVLFVKELRKIGVEVWEEDEDGKQFRVEYYGGLFGGSCDGVCQGLIEAPKSPHVLEFKTSNDKRFKILVKDGVEKSNPNHYAQMQVYMHGLDIKRALYLCTNKNDDSIYEERINFSVSHANMYINKALRVIKSKFPPNKINDRADWYQCKFCDYHLICHHDAPMDKNCRTCKHSAPNTETGKWDCSKGDEVDINQIMKAVITFQATDFDAECCELIGDWNDE